MKRSVPLVGCPATLPVLPQSDHGQPGKDPCQAIKWVRDQRVPCMVRLVVLTAMQTTVCCTTL